MNRKVAGSPYGGSGGGGSGGGGLSFSHLILGLLCVTGIVKAAGHLYNDEDGLRHHCEVKHVETRSILILKKQKSKKTKDEKQPK